MKILITGATGFVGTKVLKKILDKYSADEIMVLSSKEITGIKTVLHNNYNFDENYFAKNGCDDVDVIVHIGAYIPKTAKDLNSLENNSNILNTQKILLQKYSCLKRFIYISTVDVYSNNNNNCINESSIVNPATLYGLSKYYCEKMIETYAKENNITYQILRLGHVFGEGEEKYKKILPLTIKKVINNEDVEIWGDGEAIRTFIYIDDVAQCIVNAIELEKSNIINIVGEEQISIKDLVDKIIKISGEDIKIRYIESSVPNRNLIFDNSKLKTLLLHNLTTLDEGLSKEYKYMERLS